MATAAKFPAATAALADFLGELPNFPTMVLSGAHNNSVTTITLTATVLATWPTVGAVTIDSEIVSYTGKSGATLTGCTRGAQSTTAASHGDQAIVGFYLTAATVNQLLAEVIELETMEGKGANIASASTITPGTDGRYAQITGTTTITAIATLPAGRVVIFEFAGALTLTHNASTLILRSGANATTAAGDIYAFVSEGSGNWRELFRLTAATVASSSAVLTMHLTDDFLFGDALTGTNYGSLNWSVVATNGSVAHITSPAGHPGVIRMQSSGNASSYIVLMATAATVFGFLPAEFFDITVVMAPASTVGVNQIFRFGLFGNNPSNNTAPADGIYVEKATADTQYFGVCRASSTQTRTAAFGTCVNGTYTKFRIRRVDASTIGFTQDAGSEVLVTTNIPTAALTLALQVANITNAVNGAADFDLYDIQITGLTR